MAILIPSLIHAACTVSVQTKDNQPRLVSALGVKSVARSAQSSLGAFDLKLEQSIDPKTALLYTAVNWSLGPAVSIQAVMDSEDATLVHVYASQNVVASGNFEPEIMLNNSYGLSSFARRSTGAYHFTLAAPLPTNHDVFDGVSILVTPKSPKTLVSWAVLTSTEFEVYTTDPEGTAVDSAFSLVLLPSGQGSFTVDCDFSLLVADLGAAGVLAQSN